MSVLVIGAGSVGATIAWQLAAAGAAVTLIDAGEGPGAGCSYANAGLLSPDHVEGMANPRNVLLGLRHLFDAGGPFRLHPRPSLTPWLASFVMASRPGRAERVTHLLRAMARDSLGLHLRYVDAGVDTGCRRTGSVDRFPDGRELLNPDDATCNTYDYVTAMLRAAEEAGATIRWGTRVDRLDTVLRDTGERLVTADVGDERITATTVVLAAGLGSAALAGQVGVRLPMEGATGYVVDLARGPADPSRPVRLTADKVVITPFRDRIRACGTLDLGGRLGIQEHRVEAIRQAGRRALPHLAWDQELEVWRGDRPTMSDGAPVIGRPDGIDNLVIATGHGMWGLVLAPITAQLVCRDLIDHHDAYPSLLSPNRFRRRSLTRRHQRRQAHRSGPAMVSRWASRMR